MSVITSAFHNYLHSFRGLSRESWLLSVVMFINRSGAMVVPFMTMFITSGLGYSLTDAGYVMSCFGVGSLLGSWLGGWLVDRVGSYRVQWMSLLGSVPLYLIMPHFHSLPFICVNLFLLSTITESLRPANSVAIQLFAKKENLTRAFSLNRLAINLGFSVGPGIGGILIAFSFDWLFYVNALGNLIAGIVLIYFFRHRVNRNASPGKGPIKQDVATPIRNPYRDFPFLWFTLFCTFFCIGFLQLLNTVPVFYQQSAGLTEKEIGLVLAYSGFIIVLLEMPMVDFFERKFTKATTLFIGSAMAGISYFLYTMNDSLGMAFFSLTLLSIGEILAFPFMATVTAIRSGDRNRGAYMGLNGLSMAIGFIIAPLLGARIADNMGYAGLWYVVTALLMIGAIGMYFTTRYLERGEHQ